MSARNMFSAFRRWVRPASMVFHSSAEMIRGRRSVGMIRSVELSAP